MTKKLPKVYVCFERQGNGPAYLREVCMSEREAAQAVDCMDREPKSGYCFYEQYENPLPLKHRIHALEVENNQLRNKLLRIEGVAVGPIPHDELLHRVQAEYDKNGSISCIKTYCALTGESMVEAKKFFDRYIE